jgi:Protein of unknown function (DUF2721)
MVLDLIPELLKSPSTALTVLTSMITPALLLSAAGTFILSTSNRLGRVIDRIRRLSDLMEEIMKEDTKLELLAERRAAIFEMIDKQSARAKLLVRSLMIFYIAAGAFVATSVSIGIISLYDPKFAWIPLALGIGGAVLLFIGSMILIVEARLAISSLQSETKFLDKLVHFHYSQGVTRV